ncbi:PBP1A family penicillin-binding protein [Parashewanella spongiae]|uniref:Penicillin-binding protein 1A n=1 Tax=Parashewanella spongiae TaxID=342950 RepID=A0A3A6TLL3_9GAMM|nr:PBP1A family penicillin-binding protein [Parashewanella spongiae]MCL1078586.1 PBP1A family penicillin-binding protein [Parashewanella spongiae]RJY13114.1 PBP1A family penicillin-binding protein [Parashewanella spongiae]
MKWLKRIGIIFTSLLLLGIGSIAAAYFYVLPDLPDVATLKTIQLQTPLRIYSRDGKLISQFGEKRRIPLKLEQIPKPLLQAFLATEDARFYEHGGVDPIGVLRSAFVLLSTGQRKQGASTITMQVARNFFLTREKTIIRKIKEIFISIHIEQLLTKDEILELYVNRIFLGHRAYGVGAAAQVYYGKNVNALTLPEMAVIAGIPKAPSTTNPISYPTRAISRRNIVLFRLKEVGDISEAQYVEAIKTPNTASYHGAEIDLYAPYISEMARDYMVQKYGEEQAYTGGYNVYTTISSKIQIAAQAALRNNVYAYDQRHGYRGPYKVLWDSSLPEMIQPEVDIIQSKLKATSNVQDLIPVAVISVTEQKVHVIDKTGKSYWIEWDGLKWARSFISDTRQGSAPKSAFDIVKVGEQVWIRVVNGAYQLAQLPSVSSAVVTLDPYNGSIQALVGGYSFSQSQYNRVTQAKRQLGSNIKPFVYSATLEKGYTLATLINNAPINEPDTRQGIAWRPKNSPDVYGGPTRLREGLAKSINVMAVRAMRLAGLTSTRQQLLDFGFNPDDIPRNESIALGSPSVTPLQVVRAFSTFANGGFLVEPFYIDKITDPHGETIEQAIPTIACKNEISQAQADDPWAETFAAMSEEHGIVTEEEHKENLSCEIDSEFRYAEQVISPQVSFLIRQALKSTIWGGGNWSKGTGWNGTAWREQSLKRRDIAGKTGTTNESRDTWFSGFNPDYVSTVWVGFDDHARELGRTAWNNNLGKAQIYGAESGAKTAGPAWNEYMSSVLKGLPEKPDTPPENIISVRIDLETGKLTRKTDYTTRFEYFIEGTEPTEYVTDSTSDTNIFINNSEEDDLFQ